jgi:F1F0 ATPase subunit 2
MILAFISGFVLGVIFFGGLWFTVKKAVASKNTALWIAGSSIIRIAIVLTGIYYIAEGSWQKMVLCMVGFIVARFMVIWLTRFFEQKQIHVNKPTQT